MRADRFGMVIVLAGFTILNGCAGDTQAAGAAEGFRKGGDGRTGSTRHPRTGGGRHPTTPMGPTTVRSPAWWPTVPTGSSWG